MVWGLILKGGKPTSTMDVEGKVRISNLALFKVTEAPINHRKGDVKVWVNFEGRDRLICTLSTKRPNLKVDLVFDYGDEISFRLEGDGSVHLTGFYEDDDEDEEAKTPVPKAPSVRSVDSAEEELKEATERLEQMRIRREERSRRSRIDQFRMMRRKN